MRNVFRGLAVLVAIAIAAPLLIGIGSFVGRGAERVARFSLNMRDAKDGADAIGPIGYVYRVVQSAPTVEDSTIACALYRTPDDKFGLLAPALVARRQTADSVSIEYDDDVHKRCAPLAESRGFRITLKETPRLLQWSIEPGRRRMPRGSGLKA
jgi:hypothetical protein